MKIDLMIIAFIVGVVTLFALLILSPQNDPNRLPIERCVQNNGIPIYNNWTGKVVDCKIYTK